MKHSYKALITITFLIGCGQPNNTKVNDIEDMSSHADFNHANKLDMEQSDLVVADEMEMEMEMDTEPTSPHKNQGVGTSCLNSFDCKRGAYCDKESSVCELLPDCFYLFLEGGNAIPPWVEGEGCLILETSSSVSGSECDSDSDCTMYNYGDRCIFNLCQNLQKCGACSSEDECVESIDACIPTEVLE